MLSPGYETLDRVAGHAIAYQGGYGGDFQTTNQASR